MIKTISTQTKGLHGTLFIPGDKSISHRALLFGAAAQGTTEIKGLLEGEDVLCTAEALRKLGARIEKNTNGLWFVTGTETFKKPDSILDMGNSGTGVRLLMGLLSSYPIQARLTGDSSLCSRPMKRITDPLTQTGAVFETTEGKLPIVMTGSEQDKPFEYTLPVASAQIKSAVLLSGLRRKSPTVVHEPIPCRDHTERMLKAFGADIAVEKDALGGNVITLHGGKRLTACPVVVPADISSAAFAIVAALITPDSEIVLPNIGINPLRTGILDVLLEMGADISFENKREIAGEPVADLRVRSSALKSVNVPAGKAPSMIDEYPILAVATAFADGKTRLNGLTELKVKESNRLQAIVDGLTRNGIEAEALPDDSIRIRGKGNNACGGGTIEAKLDHRIAMSFMVMGMASESPVVIDDVSSVATSFPDFISLMNNAGANIYDYRD
ncbi:MAG: 3-phosphoshikimate 1-carboxyvinyltransferase [Alphaproteobacteria bacterium]|nr:3-phosphoshikimate 1-carboxyvinyltransferase [Alphaproteobacteria bacterium]